MRIHVIIVRALISDELKFQVLAGLPGDGPPPLLFSASGQGMHREGYVVEFTPGRRQCWIGNFQPGLTPLYEVVNDPTTNHVTVVAGGQAYVVEPNTGELKRQYGGDIETLTLLPELGATLLSNGLWFELCRGDEEIWHTKRLSWDGMRSVKVEGGFIRGEGWRYDESWHPFEVELSTGATQGGAYDGPEP